MSQDDRLLVADYLSREELAAADGIDDRRFLLALARELLTIGAAIWLCERYWHPWLCVLTVLIIGSRMNALGVLMHEATHRRALSNPWLNEAAGELLAWTLTITMHGTSIAMASGHPTGGG